MKSNIYNITINSTLISIFILFALIPWLGYIPLGIFKITLMPILFLISLEVLNLTTKINLIICSILYGFLFGLSSLIQSALYPTATAFIFINPLFSVIPRILMGISIGTLAFILKNISNSSLLKKLILSFATVTSNTLFVFLFVYFLGPIVYPKQNEIIFSFFSWMILITNYLPELLLTSFVYPPIALATNRMW